MLQAQASLLVRVQDVSNLQFETADVQAVWEIKYGSPERGYLGHRAGHPKSLQNGILSVRILKFSYDNKK